MASKWNWDDLSVDKSNAHTNTFAYLPPPDHRFTGFAICPVRADS